MKALRITAGVLGGLILLLIIVAVILVRSFDLNDYKDDISAYVEQRTGRTLAINENIEFSLFPWFAVETGGVTLSDAPEFGDRDFVTIDSFSARVRVWPLLKRRIEIGRVILDGIDINAGVDADGRGNWASLLERELPEAPAIDAGEPQRPTINALAVEGIELRNARVFWYDQNGEVAYRLSDLNLVTGPVNDNDPVDVTASVQILDVASQSSAAIEIETVAAWQPIPSLTETTASIRVLDSRQQERASATLAFGSISRPAARQISQPTGR